MLTAEFIFKIKRIHVQDDNQILAMAMMTDSLSVGCEFKPFDALLVE